MIVESCDYTFETLLNVVRRFGLASQLYLGVKDEQTQLSDSEKDFFDLAKHGLCVHTVVINQLDSGERHLIHGTVAIRTLLRWEPLIRETNHYANATIRVLILHQADHSDEYLKSLLKWQNIWSTW